MKRFFVVFGALPLITFGIKGQDNQWLTHYEKSGFLETPRYENTIAYSKQLAGHSPYIHYETMGKSPQGRDLPLLIIDRNKNFTPAQVKKSGNAVILVEGCIHAGESEGKDAGLMFIRDVIIHNKYPDLLKNTTILFIPIFNVDGHERFSAYNRINQNGPKEMGWRTTATNLNLNRDFLKAEAPEMQHWAQMFNTWLPDMFIDIHTTDGADYQYSLTYSMHVLGDMNEEQTLWQKDYLNMIENLLEKDNVLIFPYVSFRKWHDPRSGLIQRTSSPRYSTGYVANQNRPALLVETHMLKDYKTRVDACYHLLKHTVALVDKQHKQLIELNQKADKETCGFVNKKLVLDYYTSQNDSTYTTFKGVGYQIVKSSLTNDGWVQFSNKPQDYQLSLFNKILPSAVVTLPAAYIIPAEWGQLVNTVKLHGIEYKTLLEDQEFEVKTYKFNNVSIAPSTFEGRNMVRKFNMEEITLKKIFSKGSVIVPVNQRRAKIIAHLLEPSGPDSYFQWGFFNTIFERKEYVETYVMEKMAREMIEANPGLYDEYIAAVNKNPDVYNNQWSKLFWFFERTPYWDQQKDIYPVGRLETYE